MSTLLYFLPFMVKFCNAYVFPIFGSKEQVPKPDYYFLQHYVRQLTRPVADLFCSVCTNILVVKHCLVGKVKQRNHKQVRSWYYAVADKILRYLGMTDSIDGVDSVECSSGPFLVAFFTLGVFLAMMYLMKLLVDYFKQKKQEKLLPRVLSSRCNICIESEEAD